MKKLIIFFLINIFVTHASVINAAEPEIVIKANGIEIQDGDTETSTSNYTDFGIQTVGTSVSKNYTIYNTGDDVLSITIPLTISGAESSDFTVTLQPPNSVAAGDSTTFTIQYSPSGSGRRDATVNMNNNDSDENPFSFALMGISEIIIECVDCLGKEPDDPTVCNGRGNCYDKNKCDCDPGWGGPDCNTPYVWYDGLDGITEITGRFNFNPQLFVGPELSDLNGDYKIAVLIKAADIFPNTNGIILGLFQRPTANYVHDIGSEPYEYGYSQFGVKWSNNESSADTTDGFELGDTLMVHYNGPNKTLEFFVRKNGVYVSQALFSDIASEPGHDVFMGVSVKCIGECTFEIVHNILRDREQPATKPDISLKSNGTAITDGSSAVSASNNTDFGTVNVGSSNIFSYTIKNSGDGNLKIDIPLNLTGVNTADFEIVSQPDSVIAENDSTTFAVKFMPVSGGTKNATVAISSDDCEEEIFNYSITGEGLRFNTVPTASNVIFTGTLKVGHTLTASYDYSDTENDTESGSTFNWYRSDDNTGTNKAVIQEAASLTYVLTSADLGKYISFEITPNDGTAAGLAVESSLLGPIAHPFAGGSGIVSDPYQVSNAAELNAVRYYLDKYFIQNADIDLDVSPYNTGTGWEPIGTNSSGSEFSGYYNGNGYIISNLFIDRSTTDFVALFGATKNGEIKDLGLLDVNISGQNWTGSLVGLNYGTLNRCYSTGAVSGNSNVGGLIGGTEAWDGSPGEINNSFSQASITASSNGGGFIGRSNSGTIANVYSTGTASNGGGFMGEYGSGTVTSSFWDSDVAGSTGIGSGSTSGITGKATTEMKTESTFTNAGWDFTNTWEMIGQNGEDYPNLQSSRMVTINNIGTSFAQASNRNISFKSESGTIAVAFEYVESAPENIPDGGTTIGVYWEISNVSGNTKIRLYYDPTSDDGFTGTPTIYHYTGGNWVALPTEAVGTDGSLSYVETTNHYSSFSPVTVGDNASPLPVELVSFEGYNTEEGIVLNWETATETNNYGFEVQKSEFRSQNSEESWANVGFVQGHGTTNSPKRYSFTDILNLNPNLTRIDYRLKQIDNDGTFAYSKTIIVDLTTVTSVNDKIEYSFSLDQNYPNPFNPSTTIKFTIPTDVKGQTADVKLIVFDILGREVAILVNQRLQPGNHEVNFDASSLSSGMYFYRIDIGNEINSVKKMLMVK